MKKIIFILMITLLTLNVFANRPLEQNGKSPFVQVVKNIRESVVNVTVEYDVQYGGLSSQLPFNDEFFKFFFPDPYRNREPQTRKSVSMGSGFIFRKDNKDVYILTNNHVVEHSKEGEITVTLADKAKYTADVVGLDSETDLAVIKIVLDKDMGVVIGQLGNSDEIEIADWVIAIGNPFGQLGLERTVTVGVISATGRANLRFGKESPIYQDYIQTDAAINPGNSGGPLVNLGGKVIGVNAAITSTSGGNVGIGFAIPANIAKKVSNDLINYGKVRRAYMGILPQDITAEIQKSFDLDEVKGVLVAKVEENTPAEKAGLKRGDVIIQFDGKEIPNMAKFRLIVANSEIEKNIPLAIVRDKKKQYLIMKLIEKPENSTELKNAETENKRENIGLEVEDIDGEFSQRYNINEKSGVIITRVYPNSPASDTGIQPGDIILEIDRKVIKSVKDYKKYMDNNNNETLLLYVKKRSGGYLYIPVKMAG
ncbi:MAG: Do family serine endopeptidase [Candidatus Cloacimonetes bacterium]|nr:Do family serine endopeptidase [Candidatus Cloacimonadota bacterium]